MIEVVRESSDDIVARRLLELGFVPGTLVKAMHRAPLFGNPKSYLVRGTHVALRIEEARKIRVQKGTDL